MSKRVFLQLPSDVRIPHDLDFQPNRFQIESAARRAMGQEIPSPPRKNERQQRALLVAVVCFVIVAYGAFLLWVSR